MMAARITTLAMLLILTAPSSVAAQRARVLTSDPPGAPAGGYRLTLPAGSPRGLLVLFASWGETFENSLWQRIGIDTVMARADVATLEINNTPWRQNYFDGGTLERLDSIVASVVATYQIPPGRIVMGGHELGGGAALKYAIRCQRTHCTPATTPRGVFAVNAILDYRRFWTSYNVYLQRPRGVAKDRVAILASIERELGGTPDEVPEVYRRESTYVHDAADGGPARYLHAVAVRLYMDPDINWILQQTQDDYYSSSLMDMAGLHLYLTRSGNPRSEIVPYSTKNAFATNPPEPRLVVEPAALRDWVVALLN